MPMPMTIHSAQIEVSPPQPDITTRSTKKIPMIKTDNLDFIVENRLGEFIGFAMCWINVRFESYVLKSDRHSLCTTMCQLGSIKILLAADCCCSTRIRFF